MVTWAAKGRFRVLHCRVICLGGVEVVRRMASRQTSERSHDQAQIQAESCDPLTARKGVRLASRKRPAPASSRSAAGPKLPFIISEFG